MKYKVSLVDEVIDNEDIVWEYMIETIVNGQVIERDFIISPETKDEEVIKDLKRIRSFIKGIEDYEMD